MFYIVTNKKNKMTKIVEAKNPFAAKWLVSRSKKRIEEWDCEVFIDPYKSAGSKNYWKMHVLAEQRPKWVKEIYGLD